MKLTINLPATAVRKLKMLAARRGKTLDEIAAQMLRKGLRQRLVQKTSSPRIGKSKLSGLPVVLTRGKPKGSLTPDDVAQILLDQEAEWALEAMKPRNVKGK